MNKECKQCKTQFEPKTNRGHEQLYCTNTCAQQAARIRREERLKNATNENKREGQMEAQVPTPTTTTTTTYQSTNMAQQPMGGISPNGGGDTSFNISHLEKLYEARIENNYLKLKCENLEEKIRQLQIEVNELNSDIEAIEMDNEIEEQPGILGGIMQQFKTDPINTIAMVKMMFENITATKTETDGKKEKTA